MTTDPSQPVAKGAVYDSGTTLCGELAIELKIRLQAMQPGQVLEVIARDAAAPQDVPAWCELTGHALVAQDHPHYWIRRRAD